MARKKNTIVQGTAKVTVTMDGKTFNALSLLAFLKKSTVSEIITEIIDSKKNAINKEIDVKLNQFRNSQEIDLDVKKESKISSSNID